MRSFCYFPNPPTSKPPSTCENLEFKKLNIALEGVEVETVSKYASAILHCVIAVCVYEWFGMAIVCV